MKKILLFFVFVALQFTAAFPQSNITRVRDRYYGNGEPVTLKPSTNQSVYTNLQTGDVWRWYGSKWNPETDPYIIGGGQPGPQGPKGDKGDPGVCPSCPPNTGGSFPFLIVIGSGSDDSNSYQAAIDQNRTTGKPIYLMGTIRTSRELTVAADAYRLTITGYGATWYVSGGTFTALKRVTPADMNQATAMTTARHALSGFEISGSQSQVALDLGPSYGAAYRDLKIINFKTALWLQFALNTTVENCEANKCLNGFIADILHIPGANASNSQSNQTTFEHCRAVYSVPNASGEVGFGIYGSSGCGIYHCIAEGAKFKKIVDFDYLNSPNVKDFHIEDIHLEPVYGNSGNGESYIRIRLTGVAEISGIYSQYSGLLIDGGTGGGQVDIYVERVVWQLPLNGKAFNNSGGARFIFDKNSFQSGLTNPATIMDLFTGTPVTECIGSRCAGNTYEIRQ